MDMKRANPTWICCIVQSCFFHSSTTLGIFTGTGRQQQALRTSIKDSSNDGTPGSFLTMEEARLIETLNLEMHAQ